MVYVCDERREKYYYEAENDARQRVNNVTKRIELKLEGVQDAAHTE
jgi:hypothetical protein